MKSDAETCVFSILKIKNTRFYNLGDIIFKSETETKTGVFANCQSIL